MSTRNFSTFTSGALQGHWHFVPCLEQRNLYQETQSVGTFLNCDYYSLLVECYYALLLTLVEDHQAPLSHLSVLKPLLCTLLGSAEYTDPYRNKNRKSKCFYQWHYYSKVNNKNLLKDNVNLRNEIKHNSLCVLNVFVASWFPCKPPFQKKLFSMQVFFSKLLTKT